MKYSTTTKVRTMVVQQHFFSAFSLALQREFRVQKMEEVFSIYGGRDSLALKLSYQLSFEAKGGDKPV